MEHSFFHRLSKLLWGVIVTLMVLLAIYVSVGRLLASNVSQYRDLILSELNSRLPFDVSASQVAGEWHTFTPRLVLSDLTLTVPGAEQTPLELSRGAIGIDVLASLRRGSLQATDLELTGLNLSGRLHRDGRFQLTGFDSGAGQQGQWLRAFFLTIRRLALRDNVLALTLPSGELRELDLQLELQREGSRRYLEARLQSTRGEVIKALGNGVGSPFDPENFRGNLYLQVDSSDLAATGDLFAQGPPALWADGRLKLELWLGWKEGQADLVSRLEASELLVGHSEGDWRLPLDRVALQAQLLEREGRRTLFIADLEVVGGASELLLPRMQLDLWDQALRLRGEDLPLADLNQLATGLAVMPENLSEVFRTLNPRGPVDRLQLNIGDVADPADDWSLEANFSGVDVDSWKGAPGVTAATGYLELQSGGGSVVLDSQSLSLSFPTVYSEPLSYEDLYGTVDLDWDRQGLQLHSGQVTARAEEGEAKVLFGLYVPFGSSQTGIEMDLLVGLADTNPDHRVKYLPFILDAGLLEWLEGSVGQGQVDEAGFIWRGSLRREAGNMRTIQLGLNVSNTQLDYHPEWPAVDDITGIVLLDDTDVSVWGESATLYDSRLERLSAEAWLNPGGSMMLAIDGSLNGPASDGLAVLNNSMLRQYVGDAFVDWKLQGQLDARLKLLLNLSNSRLRPEVDVSTLWRHVDVDIMPGNLPLRDVNGLFTYRSDKGFASQNMTGGLWGRPLQFEVYQQPAEDFPAEGLPPVEIRLHTEVAMADVREWLDLDVLRFAGGSAPADIKVLVEPGATPRLTARSSLAGVSLDLPQPWATEADEQRALTFDMPLGGESGRFDLHLEGGVHLALAMGEEGLSGGALAFNDAAGELVTGEFHIRGHVAVLDVDGWNRFLSDYLGTGFLPDFSAVQSDTAAAGPEEVAEVAEQVQEGAAAFAPEAITIDGLYVEQLLLGEQAVANATIGLAHVAQGPQLSLETDWLQGELILAQGGQPYRLHLQRLDLAGLDEFDLNRQSEAHILRLPDTDVVVEELRTARGELGPLSFELRDRAGTITASTITGDIAGLRLEPGRPGELQWRQGEEARTSVTLPLVFDDLGESLVRFGYERVLVTEQGSMDLAVEWPGAPQDFSLAGTEGSLTTRAGAGSFFEASTGTSGALRIIGILDLASIVRRLSLSHMFEAGIPFDTVDGEVYFHGGTIEMSRLDVRGASSRFQFSGVADVASETLDGELVATLPVANNLPWVAALAGGLPVAAGVFVVSKVFEKQFDTLSSAVYRIEGSWDDPEVNFDRIWDSGTGKLPAKMTDVEPQTPTTLPGLERVSVQSRKLLEKITGAIPLPSSQQAPDPQEPVQP